MLVDDTDSLKNWLVVALEPLCRYDPLRCEADSFALARYVLALLKKDKPEKELINVMVEQLDVFLGDETGPFVHKLFAAIKSGEYLAASSSLSTEVAAEPKATSDEDTSRVDAGDPIVAREDLLEDLDQLLDTDFLDDPDETELQLLESSSTTEEPVKKPPILNKSKYLHEAVRDKFTADSDQSEIYDTSEANEQASDSAPSSDLRERVAQRERERSLFMRKADEKDDRKPFKGDGKLRSGEGDRSDSHDGNSVDDASKNKLFVRDRECRLLPDITKRRQDEREREMRQRTSPTGDYRYERRRGCATAATGVGADRNRRTNQRADSSDKQQRMANNGSTIDGAGGRNKSRFHRSSSRSRSPSLERFRSKESRNSRISPERPHHMPLVELEKRQRCRDFDEKGYCVRGETCPWDHGVNPVVFESLNNPTLISMSLREYNPDAPDLWARSSTSGGGGVVGPQSVAHAGSDIHPFTVGGGGNSGGGGISGERSVMGGPNVAGFSATLGTGVDKNRVGTIALNNFGRAVGPDGPFRQPPPILPFGFGPNNVPQLQRELIPIPVIDPNAGPGSVASGESHGISQYGKRRYDHDDSMTNMGNESLPIKQRKVPMGGRMGPRMSAHGVPGNCSLELRKVPRGLNTITHLNNHFAKFGKIVNIQISYEGDREAAIVTFSTHAEANVAYRSTEAVLNNRFIKVFWHTTDSGDGSNSLPPHSASGNARKSQYHLNNMQHGATLSTGSVTSATSAASTTSQTTVSSGMASTDDDTVTTASGGAAGSIANPASLRLINNSNQRGLGPLANTPTMLRKKQEEQAKAVVQLANGLRKRKQELLQGYVKQMKSALEVIERCDPADPQRSQKLTTIKALQETIDKLRKDINTDHENMQAHIQQQQLQYQQQSHGPTPHPGKKNLEQLKKELLDMELEMFAQQQEGNDTAELQKRIEEVQRTLAHSGMNVGSSTGTTTSPAHGIAGKPGYHHHRPRPVYMEVSTRVDRRPKTIVVTGFTSQEADFVLGHFKHFGEIAKHDMDKVKPQLIISFATRNSAEQALLRGKLFKDKCLNISWAPVVAPLSIGRIPSPQLSVDNERQLGFYTDKNISMESLSGSEKVGGNNSDTELNIGTATLPELRLEDEDDEEELEDRSWRR